MSLKQVSVPIALPGSVLILMRQEIETWVLALAYYDNQQYEEALQVFDGIADTSKILFNCGVIFATLGEHERAVSQRVQSQMNEINLNRSNATNAPSAVINISPLRTSRKACRTSCWGISKRHWLISTTLCCICAAIHPSTTTNWGSSSGCSRAKSSSTGDSAISIYTRQARVFKIWNSPRRRK